MREPEPRSTQKLSKVYVGTNGSEKIKFHMLHFLTNSLLELIFPRTRLCPTQDRDRDFPALPFP